MQTAAYSKYRLSPGRVLRSHRCMVGCPGADRPPARRCDRRRRTTRRRRRRRPQQQDDLATESGTERFVPYYSMLRSPGETQASFKLLRPFVPFSTDDSKRNLQAFMTASSDPKDYGIAGRVRSDVGRGRAVHRVQHDEHRIHGVAATQPAQHRRHRRGVRRSADGAVRRRSVVGAAGLRAADCHRPSRVAADDRVGAGVAEQERRVRQFVEWRAGEAVPRVRRQTSAMSSATHRPTPAMAATAR